MVRFAVERHVRDLREGDSRGLEFSESAANHVINFFACIKHSTGEFAGKPFICEPWQKFILWVLFGWKRRVKSDDGERLIRRFIWAYISVARGNGKSPLGAGIGNYLAFADKEARAQVYAVATKKDQARDIVFAEARNQVLSSPGMSRMVEVLRSNMHMASTDSKFEPLGSDSNTSDGHVPHGVIVDELHAWRPRHRGLFDRIETSMHKRQQPMCVMITTAGDDDAEIWAEQYDFSTKVVSGIVDDDNHFSFIAEIDKDDDELDPSVWPKANPNMGISVKLDRLEAMAAKAENVPAVRKRIKRYHCNRQVVSFYQVLPQGLWSKGNGAVEDSLDGRDCFAGFDWGWKDDLASLGLVFPIGGKYHFQSYAWIPRECKRDLSDEPWRSWIESGLLTVTDGDTTDIYSIYKTMADVCSRYSVQSVAFDPNNCREFGTRCVNDWGLRTFEFRQTCTQYNEPLRYLIKALGDGSIRHGGNKLLAWCADNVTVREDSMEYIMPSKARSKDKIDPIVALVMAISEAQFSESNESVYDQEDRGFIALG